MTKDTFDGRYDPDARGTTLSELSGVTAGSEWTHMNGNKYRVLCIANEYAERPDRYPVTVVYQGVDFKIWSRPLADWHRSMTPNWQLHGTMPEPTYDNSKGEENACNLDR